MSIRVPYPLARTFVAAALSLLGACSVTPRTGTAGDARVVDDLAAPTPSTGGDMAIAQCTGAGCQTPMCGEGAATSISGKVFDPAGKNPLYNVVVFVPSTTPAKLPSGASCDSCNSLYSGNPVAVALTDATGAFKLMNPPAGKNVPLVVQVGKWRKQYMLASVVACSDNPLPDGLLHLPRNQSEGDIPNIAISTGLADSLECLLHRVGISDNEFVGGAGGKGRVHIFAGGAGGHGGFATPPNTSPPGPSSASALWASEASLAAYDLVLLSCEGGETADMNQAAMHAYAASGGRIFASHFHYAWFDTGPFGGENLATWTAGDSATGDIDGQLVTTFPKGKALAEWLGVVGALQGGLLPIRESRHNADVTSANTPSQAWITGGSASGTQYFSFDTPTDAAKNDMGVPGYCGRVVYSDLHVGAASGDYGGIGGFGASAVVPTGCASGDLSPQEKALEFMLFDLSSCVTPDSMAPSPPS